MKDDQASSTAYTVLQGMVYSGLYRKGLVSDEVMTACRTILSASEEGKKRLNQVEGRLFPMLVPFMERMMIPGLSLHYVLRKQFIEEATLSAIKEGYTQVISLGAGFDTLTWRLHSQHTGVNFMEIDHPATSRMKVDALTGEAPLPGNLHLLAVDLAEKDLEEVLGAYSGFDPSRKTLFICEGVLPYLPQAAVTHLLAALRKLTGAGTRFVFTAVSSMSSPNNNTGPLLKVYLMFKNEPLDWTLEMADVDAFLTANDYLSMDKADDEMLSGRMTESLAGETLHRGEYVVLAEAGAQ
ncbi:MAG: class I SAM-dependent methyltransferase [Magnetococcales bacterium]|nr:class I SAM-dependent methyltransferase [Magnetococcales bacterium]